MVNKKQVPASVLRNVDLHQEIFPKLRGLEPNSFCSIIAGMVHFWCEDYMVDELWLMDVMKESMKRRQGTAPKKEATIYEFRNG